VFRSWRRRLRHFFRKTRTVNNEPINKVSLVVIILVDIFILVNVFFGLNDIGNWPISPNQEFPCYSDWVTYRQATTEDKEFTFLREALARSQNTLSLQENYRWLTDNHLGQVSNLCSEYATDHDELNTPENQQILTEIDQRQTTITNLQNQNQQIRNQYDSTLLEELAGQPRELSINAVEAAAAKQTLDRNTAQIGTLETEIDALQTDLVNSATGQQFLALLQDEAQFTTLENRYDRATFWHPTIEIFFQGLFLVPLLAIAWAVHRLAQNRHYGLVALLSWHLLVIFTVPLIVKLFQILQVGALFEVLTDLVSVILGGLLFLVSYFYILLIPLIGFGLIKFFQKVVFNPKMQAAGRVQKGRCIRCAKKLQLGDQHCPHCGYHQFKDCATCHQPTYRLLPHCRECGAPQR
jgi:hypothetical protein